MGSAALWHHTTRMRRQAPYDSEWIRTLFDDMASTYGYVNLIASFGFSARWRYQAVAELPLASADCVVDLMSGTQSTAAPGYAGV
jgi:ubiquinone/menaquinone biosynthesis C-methylase UbiE